MHNLIFYSPSKYERNPSARRFQFLLVFAHRVWNISTLRKAALMLKGCSIVHNGADKTYKTRSKDSLAMCLLYLRG